MSIYCYLCCKDCKEALYVSDYNRPAHIEPEKLSKYLERHEHHDLIYVDDNFYYIDENAKLQFPFGWDDPFELGRIL